MLSDRHTDIEEPDQLDTPDYWSAFDPKNSTNKTSHFDMLKQSMKELGFTGHLRDLPKSFLLAVANRLSRIQAESFKSSSARMGGDSIPLFFIGAQVFPSTIWQRFMEAHKAIVTPMNAPIEAIAKSSK